VGRTVEYLEIRVEDPAPLLAAMATIRSTERRGWVNLLPGVRPEDVPPPPSALVALFAPPLPEATVGTWVPARRPGREPDRVGIQHASGPDAIARLAARGLAPPPGWRVLQDHVRRGLVLALPEDEALEVVARWLLDAGAALCTLPLTGDWRVEVHRR
jgi:hypothetical protein